MARADGLTTVMKFVKRKIGSTTRDYAVEWCVLLKKGFWSLSELSDVEKRECLLKAVDEGDVATVRALVVVGVPVDGVGSDKMTLLHTAASKGYTDIVKLLLHYGADIESKERGTGFTPLHCAALNSRLEVLDLLLSCGANKEAQASCGSTALHSAAEKGFFDGVKLLLENKADTEVRTTKGLMALHGAVKANCLDSVDLLLASKAQVNAQTEQGLTPLHCAVILQNTAICLRLLNEGARLDIEDVKQRSPLLCAALTKNRDLCRALLTYGLVRDSSEPKDASAIIKPFTPLLDDMYSRLSEDNPVRALFSKDNRAEMVKMIEQRLAELRETASAMLV